MNSRNIPREAVDAAKELKEQLHHQLAGVYLYGSAVMGGLRVNSDVDVLVLCNQSLSDKTRRELAGRLMRVSGQIGNQDGVRPLEVTVVNLQDIVPWRFPPRQELLYGEWLRKQFEDGIIPQPTSNPDLAILSAQARQNSLSLYGPNLPELIEPVPEMDIRKAIRESLPGLLSCLRGDERNVILTLVRMWLTASTGEILSKDRAAEWAIPRLSNDHAALLSLARKGYLGECMDEWEGKDLELAHFVSFMKESIETCLEP